jgi:hypothetical protein
MSKEEQYTPKEVGERFKKLLQTAVNMKPQPITNKKKGKTKSPPSQSRKSAS